MNPYQLWLYGLVSTKDLYLNAVEQNQRLRDAREIHQARVWRHEKRASK